MWPLRPSTAVQKAFEEHGEAGKEGMMLHVRALRAALQDALACTSDEAIAALKRVDASGNDIQLRVKGELDVGEFCELVLAIRRLQLDALRTEATAAEQRLAELRHRVKREEAQLEEKRVEKGLPADVEAMATALGAAVAAGDDAAIRVQAHALLAKAKSIEDRRKRLAKEHLAKKHPGVSARSLAARSLTEVRVRVRVRVRLRVSVRVRVS